MLHSFTIPIAAKRISPLGAGLILFAILYLIRVAARYAGQVTAEMTALPTWLSPLLVGTAAVIGAALWLLFMWLLYRMGSRVYHWFATAMTTQEEATPDKETNPASDTARDLAQDLARTVASLERHGSQAESGLDAARLQTAALVEVVKLLAARAREMEALANSLAGVLDALNSDNQTEIARLASQVRDDHIRELLLVAPEQFSPAYRVRLQGLIAAQLGAAERWQGEYTELAGGLMAEIAAIKTRLLAVSARLALSQAARPLLEATANLDRAAHLLRLPRQTGSSQPLRHLPGGEGWP